MKEVLGQKSFGFVSKKLLTVFGLLEGLLTAGISTTLQEATAEEKFQNDSITYLMLLNPDCDWEFAAQFDYYLRVNDSQYEEYLDHDYRVICYGGIENLADIERYAVPALRGDLRSDSFVFIYPDSMVMQYNDYVEEKYGSQYRYLSLGNTDLSLGIAHVNEVPTNVKHEMAHLEMCGTWHNERGEDMVKTVKHPDAARLPWCVS